MDSLDSITLILGWCSVINIGFLSFAGLLVMLFRDRYVSIHGRMFGLGEEDLSRAYFQYLAQYKILVFVFNLVPYAALKVAA